MRSKLNKLKAQLDLIEKQIESETQSLKESNQKVTVLEEAQRIVQTISQAIQQSTHQRISDLVSRCLEAVFSDAYEFKIQFERKRGKTEAQLTLDRNGMLLEDPVNEAGGGVIDVAAFALRLVCLMLTQPRKSLFLAMDEPFRFVSKLYHPMIRGLLWALSKEFKIQFLLITHLEGLKTGKIVELGD